MAKIPSGPSLPSFKSAKPKAIIVKGEIAAGMPSGDGLASGEVFIVLSDPPPRNHLGEASTLDEAIKIAKDRGFEVDGYGDSGPS
jgi:hypothetical protein